MTLTSFIALVQLVTTAIVALGGLVAAISAFVKPLRNFFISRFSVQKKLADRMDQFEEKLHELSENQLEVANFTRDMRDKLKIKFENDKLEQTRMREAAICSTRNDLTAIYNAAEERGFLPDYDRENFLKMYVAYTELGGNSYVHELHDRILKMPNVPKKKRAIKKKTTKRA